MPETTTTAKESIVLATRKECQISGTRFTGRLGNRQACSMMAQDFPEEGLEEGVGLETPSVGVRQNILVLLETFPWN